VILDTSAVSALLAGDRALANVLEPDDHHHLPLPVVGEYQFGLLLSRKRKRLTELFRRLESESQLLVPDRATADGYASIRLGLRQKGCPIPENNIWIAALALQYSLKIVSNDAHFDVVDKVQRLGW